MLHGRLIKTCHFRVVICAQRFRLGGRAVFNELLPTTSRSRLKNKKLRACTCPPTAAKPCVVGSCGWLGIKFGIF